MQVQADSKKADVKAEPSKWHSKVTGSLQALRQMFQPKQGLNHKAMMRQDWTAKTEKFMALGAVLALAVLPEYANADVDMTPLKNLLKTVVNFLIFDMGYYLGIAAIAIQGMRAKSGRIEWSAFFWTCAGVFIVFFAPNFVTQIKNGAATTL